MLPASVTRYKLAGPPSRQFTAVIGQGRAAAEQTEEPVAGVPAGVPASTRLPSGQEADQLRQLHRPEGPLLGPQRQVPAPLWLCGILPRLARSLQEETPTMLGLRYSSPRSAQVLASNMVHVQHMSGLLEESM